ncbi:MAG: hypothetical protein M3Y77_22145 [Actinomycetota bacterium]|nr:hypothetical protein [Actinomycetota bacterium]
MTVVLDETLLDCEQLNFHPMNHTESIGLSPEQLQHFLAGCAHPPVLVRLS